MNNSVAYRRPAAGRLNPVWDNFFSDFFEDNYSNCSCRKPSANVKETEKSFEFELDLPGFNEDELDVSVEKNLLEIKAEKKKVVKEDETAEEKSVEKSSGKLLISERVSGFFRSFMLPETADTEKIHAKYENGVLYLSIDKKEKELPKKIKIN